jgi:hypothetical protein
MKHKGFFVYPFMGQLQMTLKGAAMFAFIGTCWRQRC